MNIRLVLPIIAALSLAACATAPKPLQGQFNPVAPREATNVQLPGALVRWGGRIIDIRPGQDQTCFQMLARPLNASGRPAGGDASDANDGRFIACRSGFYDPAVFQPGREVTFIGKISSYESTRIGDFDYRLPKIDADVVYLWPVIREVQVVDPWGPWGPGPWGPWGPGPWGRGPWWGPRWGW